MWPECVLVVGKFARPVVQYSIGGSESDVRHALGYWMTENKTKKWSKGLRYNFLPFFVQLAEPNALKISLFRRTRYHMGLIKISLLFYLGR